MDKDYINKILSILSISAAAAFICGSFIINAYLRHFQILDFKLLQPHAIIVGFSFFLFFLMHAFVYLMYLDINYIGDNSLIKTLALSVIKVAYLSVVITLFFDPKILFDPLYTLRIFSCYFNVKICFFFLLSFPFNLVVLYKEKTENANTKNLFTVIYKIFVGLGLLSTIILLLTYLNHPIFSEVLKFQLFFVFILMGAVVFLPGKEPLNNPEFNGTLFSKGPITKKTQLYLLVVLSIVCLVPGFLFAMERYSEVIYPRISQAFGGGKAEKISYILEKDIITGYKLYESENYVFIQQSDSTIAKVEWADIKKIILSGK